jgi:uncharacterized protein with HEPN domain
VSDPDELLAEFLSIVNQLRVVYARDRPAFDADELGRYAVQQLWIALGETARRYVNCSGTPRGTQPWSEVVAHRHKLAHLLRAEVNVDLLWSARGELDGLAEAAHAAQVRRPG